MSDSPERTESDAMRQRYEAWCPVAAACYPAVGSQAPLVHHAILWLITDGLSPLVAPDEDKARLRTRVDLLSQALHKYLLARARSRRHVAGPVGPEDLVQETLAEMMKPRATASPDLLDDALATLAVSFRREPEMPQVNPDARLPRDSRDPSAGSNAGEARLRRDQGVVRLGLRKLRQNWIDALRKADRVHAHRARQGEGQPPALDLEQVLAGIDEVEKVLEGISRERLTVYLQLHHVSPREEAELLARVRMRDRAELERTLRREIKRRMDIPKELLPEDAFPDYERR